MIIKSWMAAFGLAMCLLAQPVMAGPLEDGSAAYERGDYSTALQLWQPLADQGNAVAQSNLGNMYSNGQGVPQDYAEAVKWYRRAAEQGNARGQYGAGVMYYFGQGVPQDYAQAAKWFRKAADQGHTKAHFMLGLMYSKGQGVPQDFVQAHMWFNLSAAGVPASDTRGRDFAAGKRDLVAAIMTPDQIAEAQRLAREWLAAHPKP